MPDRVDFSRNAPVYDQRHGAFLPDDAAQRLATAAKVGSGARVLDVGAGTGRVAIPFAAVGCDVVGVDASAAMLASLSNKAATWTVRTVVADAVALPFSRACFDAVVMARMLYLLPRWRDAVVEAARVLTLDGVVLHEWGNGQPDEAWVQIREKARSLFEKAGLRSPFHPGARTEDEVDTLLAGEGLRVAASVRLENDVHMTLADFLRRIVNGECSYIWNVPTEIQQRCLPELESWAAQRFDLDRLAFTRPLTWTIYRRRLSRDGR